MLQLLGDRATTSDEAIMRELFLQILPNNARMILETSSNIPLDCLAELADKILETTVPSVASATQVPSTYRRGKLNNFEAKYANSHN